MQFLNNVIINKTKVLLPQVTVANFVCSVSVLWFYCSPILLNYLAFQSFDFERA